MFLIKSFLYVYLVLSRTKHKPMEIISIELIGDNEKFCGLRLLTNKHDHHNEVDNLIHYSEYVENKRFDQNPTRALLAYTKAINTYVQKYILLQNTCILVAFDGKLIKQTDQASQRPMSQSICSCAYECRQVHTYYVVHVVGGTQ